MTKTGKIVFTLVIVLLAGIGITRWNSRSKTETESTASSTAPAVSAASSSSGADSFEYLVPGPPPKLPAPQAAPFTENTITINLSEYAGYAGIILANKGLEPNDESWFTQNGGFKVRITLSEEDTWDQLQEGKITATATTADVLANYGRQWHTVVPMQIAWSRGADGIIVRKDIRRINDLKGKRVATAPFSEAEFFIRYLAQEAGLPVARLDGIDGPVNTDAINLVFLEDAFEAGDAFVADLQSGGDKLAGCVTWAPKTTEIVADSNGEARQLIDNRNLLIIADILLFNKGFAEAHPKIVEAIVEGSLHFNERIRSDPAAHAPALAEAFAAFEWTAADALDELSRVHLSNLPENLAFFRGAINEAGSFASVYQSANLAYGPELTPQPAVASGYFAHLTALEAIDSRGELSAQVASIEPVRSSQRAILESDPLLTRDIQFFFLPNDHRLDMDNAENGELLADVRRLLGVSPGSIVFLRGHVDDTKKEEFRQQGAEVLRTMALNAMALSSQRADEVKMQLLARYPETDPQRIETVGRGWEEPAGSDSDANRRVEVQWYTVE